MFKRLCDLDLKTWSSKISGRLWGSKLSNEFLSTVWDYSLLPFVVCCVIPLCFLLRMGHADNEISAAFERFDRDGNNILDKDEQERMKQELEEKRVGWHYKCMILLNRQIVLFLKSICYIVYIANMFQTVPLIVQFTSINYVILYLRMH